MRPIVKLSAVGLATVCISSFRFVADAFTSLPQTRTPHCYGTTHHHHGLEAKKKRGSFLDEFPEDKPAKSKVPTQDEFHSDLLSWLKRNPLTYINPKFKIYPSELGGYGGFCSPDKKAMQENEMILCIPRECCVTFNDAINDEKCGGAFRMIREHQLPDWELLLIAGWAAKEYMVETIHTEKLRREGMSNEEELHASKSKIKHWPYLKTVPWKRGELDQEHVLFWSDDEVETLLKGSLAYDDAKLIRSRVQNATKLMNDLAIGPLLRGEMGIKASENIDGLEEAVTAAFVIALSRSFAEEVEVDNDDGTTEIEEEILLIPLLDILQHSNEPNTLVESYDNYIILKARRTILPGEEVSHQYQEEDDALIPPHKFFTRYGFIPGVQESVLDLLEEKSSIFFDEPWLSQF